MICLNVSDLLFPAVVFAIFGGLILALVWLSDR